MDSTPPHTSLFKKVRLAFRRAYEIRTEGLVDVVDEASVPTGESVNIYAVHERGLWHRTANVYIVNSKGEVLLQKRSKYIRVFPNMWSLSAGGHVRSGQTSLEAVVDELREELAVSVDPKEFIQFETTIKNEVQPGGWDREFHDNFIVYKDLDIKELKAQSHEVTDLQWIDIETYRKIIAAGEPDYLLHKNVPAFFKYIDEHGTGKK